MPGLGGDETLSQLVKKSALGTSELMHFSISMHVKVDGSTAFQNLQCSVLLLGFHALFRIISSHNVIVSVVYQRYSLRGAGGKTSVTRLRVAFTATWSWAIARIIYNNMHSNQGQEQAQCCIQNVSHFMGK